MKIITPTFIIALVLIIIACDRKPESPTDVNTTNKREAKTAAKAIPYKSEIEEGLTKQFNYIKIPLGKIEVMSARSSEWNEDDWQRKRFRNGMHGSLSRWQTLGLIRASAQPKDDSYAIAGTKKYVISPTQMALEASDEKLSTEDYLFIKTGNCTIKSIVKDTEYNHPKLPQSEDFRLVIGTYRRVLNDFIRSLTGEQETLGSDEVFKFRVLIRVNPFNQTYSSHLVDWGYLDKDGWESDNIP